MKKRNQHAFTLLEVLVALMVIAVGLTATIVSSIEITRNSLHLQNKTLAHWVAQNVIAERKIQTGNPANLPLRGEMQMANQTWQWQVERSKTTHPSSANNR